MNEKQREMARHALGLLNRKHTSYRNHYCVGPGSGGYDEWEELVSRGLAIKKTGDLWGGDSMFHLTLKGALMVRDAKEHLSQEDTRMMHAMETV